MLNKAEAEKRMVPFVPTLREFILLGTLLCLAGLLFLLSVLTAGTGDEVVITVGQREHGRYTLGEDRIIEIIQDNHRNVVEIVGGQAHMQSADCPDKLCVKQGFIHSDLYTIVCLPNRVVVEVRTHG